jgi:hypothetical protein
MNETNWVVCELDVNDQTIHFATVSDGLRRAVQEESGHLYSSTADGRHLSFRFDSTRSWINYMGTDKVIVRPHFPARPDVEEQLNNLFCKSCGILLVPFNSLLAFGMERREGFRLCEAIFRTGTLPSSVPENISSQPHLPGMEETIAEVAEWNRRWRVVEWRAFGPTDETS